MRLNTLFNSQQRLDEKIVAEKGLEGQDLLPEKILALQVELGELANEWRGFKFWSEDRTPKIFEADVTGNFECECEQGYLSYGSSGLYTCDKCEGQGRYNNPLLGEYVDCLHFILSIGLEMQWDETALIDDNVVESCSVTHQFLECFYHISAFEDWKTQKNYSKIVYSFVHLGKVLGFEWEQIEEAYFQKNQINHERQDNGY